MVYLVNIAFFKVVLRKKNLNIFGLKSMKIGEKTHFEIYSVFSRLLFVMLLQKRTNLPKTYTEKSTIFFIQISTSFWYNQYQNKKKYSYKDCFEKKP